MFNPAKASDLIKKEYIAYISTTFHFRNQNLQNKLCEELERSVSNGPFVEIKDSFKSGKSIEQMIVNGFLSPLFRDLEKNKKYNPRLPLTRPLYLHQEKAIEKIVTGENVVISTGTGSGKTNCFLIPVINELLREKEDGKLNDGVRAIFIYPMNALANDQIKGLREIVMAYPDIRFGVYNGGTENKENDAIKLYESMYSNERYPELRKRLPNEELSRDEMKNHPPHILFTNYAMLEHMLFRPGDDALFANSFFKFIVLDEAHVYAGATGIETAFLIGRLLGRINCQKKPQFILTSATLGDGSDKANENVVKFANNLTGCCFTKENVITAYRDNSIKNTSTSDFDISLFSDLANENNIFEDILQKYNLNLHYSIDKEGEILYDLISSSSIYRNMRKLGNLITLDQFSNQLGITQEQAVAFVSLCAKAKQNGKPLVDIRYHYFLKALDGCYLALDYKDSLSLIRKESFKVDFKTEPKMFEIAVCEDCGEIAIVGKIENNKLIRSSGYEDKIFFQVHFNNENFSEDEWEDIEDEQSVTSRNEGTTYILCKNCGAITPEDEAHNTWCTCGNKQTIKLSKSILTKSNKVRCLNCGGSIRQFILGYDAATGVIATSLYEQIPEYTFTLEQSTNQSETANPFLQVPEKKKSKSKTGSQFLVFSDSRQGAAKFACYLSDMYKQFLRRRGIWEVVMQSENAYDNGVSISDFVGLLINYYSSLKLFRSSNSDNADPLIITENRRNAWVAVLDELFNCNRDTSLVALGKISFDYLGNHDQIVNVVVHDYKLTKEHAKNFLNYLAFEIVRAAAILTDNETDINDSDRAYLFFTPNQKGITKNKDNTLHSQHCFLPTPYTTKNGEKRYYRSNKLILTKKVLHIDDEKAVQFLENYWGYLVSDENDHKLKLIDKGYYLQAKSFNVKLGKNAVLWKCCKCGKVSQFNLDDSCIHTGCEGRLERLNSEAFCRNNYYAMLYQSSKLSPLFVKEHTAQLAKKEALEYQQLFIRKEINALSCSTTFEMGVDVGDLETVFLRNIPPLASNYAQRVGRAGRSINAAAFALTYARLSSHDFTFFDNPKEMINGVINPPNITLENEKILKRHVYAVAISLYLRLHPDLYLDKKAFINGKGYENFLDWLRSKPAELSTLLQRSFFIKNEKLTSKYVSGFEWLEEFCGDQGLFTKIILEYETNVAYLKKEYENAMRARDERTACIFKRNLDQYQKHDLIDFLVRGNILPKYGFPIDSVELTQNLAATNHKSLNLNRDLLVAIAEYAPSGQVVADGGLYTSRYIRKPIVNQTELNDFEKAYFAICPECDNINFSNVPIANDGKKCAICGHILRSRDFNSNKSIEPRAGFIAEEDVKDVPLTTQEKKYKTEAIYIGDKTAYPISKYNYEINNISIEVESTTNDSLVVKSTDYFYVCPKCGYSIANNEIGKLTKYNDYRPGVMKIERIDNQKNGHKNPFGKGTCNCTSLSKYYLHHEFRTDVAKISFGCDTSDNATMLSVMYALLNSFANELNIERRDIKACLTYKKTVGKMEHKIIIYDTVPGGAGHSRRLVTEDGYILKAVIERAVDLMNTCKCDPSCYRCLRNYENQQIHETLNRNKALVFLKQFYE